MTGEERSYAKGKVTFYIHIYRARPLSYSNRLISYQLFLSAERYLNSFFSPNQIHITKYFRTRQTMAEKRGSSHHHRRSSTTSGSGWHKQPNQGESSGKQTEKHAESHSKKQSSEKHHSKRVQSSETYPQDGPGDRSVIEQGEKQRVSILLFLFVVSFPAIIQIAHHFVSSRLINSISMMLWSSNLRTLII